MVRLAQMECFHPAGEMDDAHLLSPWSAHLIKEAELQAEAANVKLLSNRRLIVVNPQKHHHPPRTTARFRSGALELIGSLHEKFGWCENGSIMRPPTAAADPRLHELQEPICLLANIKRSPASTLAPPLFRTGLRPPLK